MTIQLPRLRVIALALPAACAMSIALGGYFGAAFGGTMCAAACLLMLVLTAALRPKKKVVIGCSVLGAAFSAFRVIGYSYDTLDSYGLIMKSTGTLLSAAAAFLALFVFATCAMIALMALLRCAGKAAVRTEAADPRQKRITMILCAAMIFAGAMPYLVLYAPGLNIFDTHDQILQYFGYPSYIGDGSALSDHHPVFLTVVYGLFMRLGLALGNANIGQMLYSLLSVAAIAACYAIAFGALYDAGLRAKAVLILSGCVALYPVLALYSFNMCKDVSAAPFVLLYLAQMIRLHISRGQLIKKPRFALSLFAVMLLLMLTRKPSLYALAFAALFMILAYPGVRMRMAAVMLGAAALFQIVYTGMILPAAGVIPGESREMLSVPFQQVARVLCEDKDSLTQDELAAVSRVLDVEHSAQHYDPRLSDPVKDTSNPDMTGEDLAAFLKAWVSIGMKHPMTYVEAWLNLIYGYFYPSDSNTIVCLTLNSPDQGGVVLTQRESLDAVRLEWHNIIYYRLRQLPILGSLFYVDTVTWAFLFLLLYTALCHGFAALAPSMYLVGTLGICMLSPKSGEIRYLMPILYALPVMIGAAFLPAHHKESVK